MFSVIPSQPDMGEGEFTHADLYLYFNTGFELAPAKLYLIAK